MSRQGLAQGSADPVFGHDHQVGAGVEEQDLRW